MSQVPGVAAIVTTYFPGSHADVIVTKFLRGFETDDGLIRPRTRIASLYIDQIHTRDIGRQLAHEFNIPVYESIRSALTLGTDDLAVDAVLLIGEHGDYPKTGLDQEMLPRRYFFEQICGVIENSNRPVPVYNDKHLAYRWDDAHWMYTTAKEMAVPLWAASALPLSWRKPNWQHPLDEPIDQALVVGFHMVERYGFHALEALQCQVERRSGGETGIRSVQCLAGDEVWRSGDRGQWSRRLADAALAAIEDGPGRLDPQQVDDPHVYLIDYVDRLKAAALMLGDTDYIKKVAYAQQQGPKCDAIEYHAGDGPPHAIFGYLGLNIEDFFLTGRVPNPVERTYLTTGILEAAMISRGSAGTIVPTPHLANIRYTVGDFSPRRPSAPRPAGASLEAQHSVEPGQTPAAAPIAVSHVGTIRGRRQDRS